MATISPSTTIRRSPYHAATLAEGVTSFATYNHMLMPLSYGDLDAEYRRLTTGVALWDVGCERQVEVAGPDAARLVQALVPRRIDAMGVGVGWYVPVCDHRGVLINDPVLLRLAPDRFWFSIADMDLLWWVRAIAAERGLDARVHEPDVSPLAVQGPRAEDVVAALLGDEVRALKHFRHRPMTLDGIPFVLCRSGWSHQGGFELFLEDGARGDELWARVRAAGEPFGIGPGAPNEAERIESGLLSWNGDCDDATTPFEVRMGRYVDLGAPDDTVGMAALRRLAAEGPRRHQVGLVLDGDARLPETPGWAEVRRGAARVGDMTARTWSPRLGRNAGFGLLARDVAVGERVAVALEDGREAGATVRALPFF